MYGMAEKTKERCPYWDCDFRGTLEEVDEHVVYMIGIGDLEHAPNMLYSVGRSLSWRRA